MKLERETRKEYRYEGLGLPVVIKDAPMVKIRGQWVLDVDFNHLQAAVFRAMAEKQVRLSGRDIRFIRHHAGMTLQEFADRFGVSHPAVMNWEKSGADATNMKWATEKDIRLFTLAQADAPGEEFKATYTELRDMPSSQKRLHRLNIEDLASL